VVGLAFDRPLIPRPERVRFSSVKELIAKIEHFIANYNKDSAPFSWTATADSILEKLHRLCSQISGTSH
jgi:putative transposase